MRQILRKIYAVYALITRRRSIITRALVCSAVGFILIVIDQSGHHDLRYRLRGPTTKGINSHIVLVDLNERDWLDFNHAPRNTLRLMKEVSLAGNPILWDTPLWERLLSRILKDLPSAVGVTFFFGDNIHLGKMNFSTRSLFEDSRIIWGADLDSEGRALIPTFATTYNQNIAIRSLRPDDDGMLRRYQSYIIQTPHMAVRLAELAQKSNSIEEMRSNQELGNTFDAGYGGEVNIPLEINFRETTTLPVISARDILKGTVPPEAFHNKIVIIGDQYDSSDAFNTPLGRMSRIAAIANMTDNILSHQIPRRSPLWLNLLLVPVLVALTITLILSYPQSIVIFGLSFVALCWLSLSAWLFDSFAIWLPAATPTILIGITYIVFLSHQVATNEARNYRLEQSRKASEELERLKTNFVSMMSHDLKTPIAKIQAICDRLLTYPVETGLNEDLKNLRRSSDDLHHYIRSILQVTKIEAREFAVSREPVDINESIGKVLTRLAPLAQEKNISLDSKLEPMFSIEADMTMIEEMIHNLVENAIKYTPNGGAVTISSSELNDHVVVTVEDSGPGIPTEDQERVWNKFTRGLKVASNASGSGLGLYLVKYFVELHGGRVFLSSTPGSGTKIGFKIPLEN